MKHVDWEITIEYGPVAETHFTIVSAISEEDALTKGQEWADAKLPGQNAKAIGASEIFPDDGTDAFGDDIEWTIGEEEEFLRILDNPESEE